MTPSRISHPDAPQGITPPEPHTSLPTFGLVVVGDELLSGRRKDGHIPKTIELLGQRGLQLAYAHMVKDDRARLTQLLQQLYASNDVVFCCGGIGATPDDHTRQAAAAAAGVALAMHDTASNLITQRMQEQAAQQGTHFDPQSPDHQQRLQMALFPAGAEIIPNPYNRIAGFSLEHMHFFPGFPVMAWPMMAWVLDHFYTQWHGQTDWAEHALILPNASEAALTPLMERIEAQWPNIKIFSLPSVNHPRYGAHIELGVKGPQAIAAQAFAALQQALREMQQTFISPEAKRN